MRSAHAGVSVEHREERPAGERAVAEALERDVAVLHRGAVALHRGHRVAHAAERAARVALRRVRPLQERAHRSAHAGLHLWLMPMPMPRNARAAHSNNCVSQKSQLKQQSGAMRVSSGQLAYRLRLRSSGGASSAAHCSGSANEWILIRRNISPRKNIIGCCMCASCPNPKLLCVDITYTHNLCSCITIYSSGQG